MGNAAQVIEAGKAVLGIEFGSTRIKAVLVEKPGIEGIVAGHRLDLGSVKYQTFGRLGNADEADACKPSHILTRL